jgi:hypothetical protein
MSGQTTSTRRGHLSNRKMWAGVAENVPHSPVSPSRTAGEGGTLLAKPTQTIRPIEASFDLSKIFFSTEG